jgi:hypothetical protein
MNRSLVMATIIVSTLALPVSVDATEVPSKKPEVGGTAAVEASSAPSSAKAAEAKKGAEALKWDQLDPRALENAAKKAQTKSPFTIVPAER